MKPQSYQNYIRFYAPHHFVFYPLASILFFAALYFAFSRPEKALWIFIGLIILLIIWVSYMMRQHYALTLQNRIVRLEVRMRYFTLTGKRFDDFEHELGDSQIFALRFASDPEFVTLTEKARDQKTDAETIKKSIRDWKADNDRV